MPVPPPSHTCTAGIAVQGVHGMPHAQRTACQPRPTSHRPRRWPDVLCQMLLAGALGGCAAIHGTDSTPASGVQVYGEVDVSVGWTARGRSHRQ